MKIDGVSVTSEGADFTVLWQKNDDGAPEPAISFRIWSGDASLELICGDNSILLNTQTIPLLIKELKRLHRQIVEK